MSSERPLAGFARAARRTPVGRCRPICQRHQRPLATLTAGRPEPARRDGHLLQSRPSRSANESNEFKWPRKRRDPSIRPWPGRATGGRSRGARILPATFTPCSCRLAEGQRQLRRTNLLPPPPPHSSCPRPRPLPPPGAMATCWMGPLGVCLRRALASPTIVGGHHLALGRRRQPAADRQKPLARPVHLLILSRRHFKLKITGPRAACELAPLVAGRYNLLGAGRREHRLAAGQETAGESGNNLFDRVLFDLGPRRPMSTSEPLVAAAAGAGSRQGPIEPSFGHPERAS